MTQEEKNHIDNMSFETMMYMNRFEPIGSDFLIGEKGEYFCKVFKEKQEQLQEGEYTSISRRIGWNK